MKKKAIISLLLLIGGAACNNAQPPPQLKQADIVWLSSYDEAVKASAENNKPILMEFSTEWCPYCKFIDERIINNPSYKWVKIDLNNFILLKLDGDKPETQSLMDKFNVKGFPTFVILSSQGKELSRFSDVNSGEEFSDRLLNAAISEEDKLKEKCHSFACLNALIKKYSDSPFLPEYYKRLADLYSFGAIKKKYLKEAAKYVEWRIAGIKKGTEADFRLKRITLDQHIDLLAEIYKELKLFDKISPLYFSAGKLCEKEISENGGIKNNKHLISITAYYYLNANKLDSAKKFLKKALTELPNYWPAYSNYAKVMIAENNSQEAVNFAKKAYELADDIAKPRIAFTWAEAYGENYKEAESVLKMAENDLLKTGSAQKGRAKNLLDKIRAQIKEFKKLP